MLCLIVAFHIVAFNYRYESRYESHHFQTACWKHEHLRVRAWFELSFHCWSSTTVLSPSSHLSSVGLKLLRLTQNTDLIGERFYDARDWCDRNALPNVIMFNNTSGLCPRSETVVSGSDQSSGPLISELRGEERTLQVNKGDTVWSFC